MVIARNMLCSSLIPLVFESYLSAHLLENWASKKRILSPYGTFTIEWHLNHRVEIQENKIFIIMRLGLYSESPFIFSCPFFGGSDGAELWKSTLLRVLNMAVIDDGMKVTGFFLFLCVSLYLQRNNDC